ncbi:MAG: pyridoxal-dependent decarboxylase [Bacteroidota bacterium]
MANYLEKEMHTLPVKSNVKPGDIKSQVPLSPPNEGEDMDHIFDQFKRIIIPGMTHWQHPKFFAYFPGNSSYPSVLAEMLTATLAAQCMLWDTSPSAAELEERMMEWLRQMIHLPDDFVGTIQNSASSSTLVAILSAREKFSNFEVNKKGLYAQRKLRVYACEHIHSSIEKAVRIAGLGDENFVPIKSDEHFSLIPSELDNAIQADIEKGYLPICVVSAFGTTSSTAIDPIDAVSDICEKHGLWHHVDAAYSGTALILEKFRTLANGYQRADSLVFNPHKWMFTNFDCSAYFVRDKKTLLRTFTILPEYLKTKTESPVTNYNEWGIQLARRFRALKLWFVIRTFGVDGIRQRIEEHLSYAKWLTAEIKAHPQFELIVEPLFNLVCFRFNPANMSETALNELNADLIERLNASGKLYMTHTKLGGKYTLRMVIGQTYVQKHHVEEAWETIKVMAERLV